MKKNTGGSERGVVHRRGAIRLGVGIGYDAPGVIELIGRDWDWFWLDGQHGQIAGYEGMLSMVRACDSVGVPAYVRVRDHSAGSIGVMLDMGAAAIIVPQVDTVEAALGVVSAGKFPPLGDRSFGSRRLFDRDGAVYAAEANRRTGLICQIESPTALENAAEIVALEGVDGLFIGPDDLGLRWGKGNGSGSNRDLLDAAVRHVGGLCRDLGKICICPAIDAAIVTLCIESGVDHLVASSDARLLRAASAERRSLLMGLIDGSSKPE